MKIQWHKETAKIEQMVKSGVTLQDIGETYGVSHQRIYQVLQKFGIETPLKKRKTFLTGKPPKYYWLNKMLTAKQVPKKDRLALLETMEIPDVCPVFGLTLNYNGTGEQGFTRGEDSPSIDRIDSSKGYTKENIQIISWRANRIKNDSTPEELRLLADYMEALSL